MCYLRKDVDVNTSSIVTV